MTASEASDGGTLGYEPPVGVRVEILGWTAFALFVVAVWRLRRLLDLPPHEA